MKEEGENINFSTPTEFLVLFQAWTIVSGIVFGIFYLIFAELKATNFLIAVCFIAAILLITSIVWLCKLFVDFIHKKLKVEALTKYRNDYLIAFGTIGMFIVVLRVLPYFSTLSKETLTVTSLVYLITSTSIYYFFVFQTLDKKCTWIQLDEKTWIKFIVTTVLINVVLLIVCIRISVEYDDIIMRNQIILGFWLWTFPFAITFAELARVLLFGLQLIDSNGNRNEVTKKSVELKKVKSKSTPKPEPPSKPVAPKPTCNICSAPYTENGVHTPRIIRECGHSVCEQCADKLLNAKCQNILLCPFCQKPTIVNGPAGTLPKNFALLEQMTEMQQDPIRIV
ncbi:hypothetical protein CAEBREN_01959 [Caenorhabditis brenneri]|uniref:RING-type domain-containing protein n=1 Tax=Caenorhabditis brenneri TaxID=135651 RepID=G0MWU7_CAEBE|nr:hypothetical protein CAEBREN_01959 [Caenorhabditis brenneri]